MKEYKTIWFQELNRITEFNRVRRCYRDYASFSSGGKQLIQALMFAEKTDNHHFRFWLVRNHVGDLPRGESEQA
jgi:hypothetical protein